MSRFKEVLQIIEEGLLKPMSDTDIASMKKNAVADWIKEIKSDPSITENKDGSYDVDGDMYIDSAFIGKISKLPIKFRRINGNFDCSLLGLTTLEGCPEIVEESFSCENNNLTNLIDGPKTVNGSYYNCDRNKLTSLEGAPISFNNYNTEFSARRNLLTTLKGLPEVINGSLLVDSNLIKTLDDCPKEITHTFDISNNPGNFTKEQVRKVCKVGYKIVVKF